MTKFENRGCSVNQGKEVQGRRNDAKGQLVQKTCMKIDKR